MRVVGALLEAERESGVEVVLRIGAERDVRGGRLHALDLGERSAMTSASSLVLGRPGPRRSDPIRR